jgi:hypothetical protein
MTYLPVLSTANWLVSKCNRNWFSDSTLTTVVIQRHLFQRHIIWTNMSVLYYPKMTLNF